MRPTLTLVTPPADEPVSLAEAKAWLRIDTTDDDALLGSLVTAARLSAEEHLRRSLLTQAWKLTLDLPHARVPYSPGVYDLPVTALTGGLPRVIPLPKGPVQAVASVTTYDLTNTATVLDPATYRVDPSGDRLTLAHGAVWPANLRPLAACEIVYTAGYSAVPQPVKTGLLIHLASLYEQRGMCDDAMALPPGAAQLYGPYRVMDFRG